MVARNEPDLPVSVTVTQTRAFARLDDPREFGRREPGKVFAQSRRYLLFAKLGSMMGARSTNHRKVMNLKQYATMRGFETAHYLTNAPVLDSMLQGPEGDRIREETKLKRLQFDCAPSLYDQVERVCSKMECSKREFLEMAVAEAIQLANEVWDESFTSAADPEVLERYSQPLQTTEV